MTPFPAATRARDEGVVLERDAELEALDQEVALAASGDGRAVTIEGPPGIGKTRLLGAAMLLASGRGMLPLRARGGIGEAGIRLPASRASRFGPVARDPRLEAAALAGPAERARSLFDPGAAEGEAAHDEQTVETMNALLWLAINLSEHRPLMLAVDDAQWADLPSVRALTYLSRRLDGLRILVLVARRREDSVDAEEAELGIGGVHRALRPAPLSEQATATLIRDALGQEAEPAFARSCHRSTGGNPLLLHELLRASAARRVSPDGANLDALAELGPEAVSRTVGLRLAETTPEAKRLAESATILGDGSRMRQAVELAELESGAGDAAAVQLRRLELLAPGATVAFVHPLVREALHRGLDPLAAEAAHARAAEILERDGAPNEAVAAQLLGAAPDGRPERVETLRRAAIGPLAAGDGFAAAKYLRRALAEGPEESQRPALLLELASAEATFDGDAAIRRLEETIPLIDDPATRAEAAARLAALYPSFDPGAAIETARRALDELPEGDAARRRQLLAIAGTGAAMVSPRHGLPDELLGPMRKGERAGDEGARMIAAILAYRDVWSGVPIADCRRRAERAFTGDWLSAVSQTGGPFAVGYMALIATESELAPRAIEEWGRLGRREGSLSQYSGAKMLSAHMRLARGQVEDAAHDATDALEAMEDWGLRGVAVAHAAAALCEASVERGDLEGAARALERARCSDVEAGAVGLHGLLAARARLREAGGELRAALDETMDLGRRFEELGGAAPALVPWRSRAALLMHVLDEGAERARELVEEETEAARAWGGGRALGRALTVRGLLAGGMSGMPDLEEALGCLTDVRAPLERVRARLAQGRVLATAGSQVAARDPLRHALEEAAQCGAARLEDAARAELIATGARPRRTALTGPGALTDAERRVARLAAAGAANREIAGTAVRHPEDRRDSPLPHLPQARDRLALTARRGARVRPKRFPRDLRRALVKCRGRTYLRIAVRETGSRDAKRHGKAGSRMGRAGAGGGRNLAVRRRARLRSGAQPGHRPAAGRDGRCPPGRGRRPRPRPALRPARAPERKADLR